jgi:hypothetical protein
MLRVYGDISGRPTDAAMMVACYIGTEDQWLSAEAAWRAVLLAGGIKSYTHATTFFSGANPSLQFKRGSPEHTATALRLAGVAQNHGLTGIATAFDAGAYERVMQPAIRQIEAPHKPWSSRAFGVQFCLANVARVLGDHLPSQQKQVAIIFEDEKGMGQAADYYRFCERKKQQWTEWFSTFTLVPKRFVPAQIADWLAYHTWLLAIERAKGVKAPESAVLQRMLVGGGILMKQMTDQQIEAAVPKMLAFLEDHPDGMGWSKRK